MPLYASSVWEFERLNQTKGKLAIPMSKHSSSLGAGIITEKTTA